MPEHKEAFCLMWYGCKCGHRERVWNSRDGVTPFGCGCPSCGATMFHVEWQRDEPAPDHKLFTGQRFWRDGTPEEAETIMRRRIERSKGIQCDPSPELAAKLIQSARTGDSDEFRKGWPMLDVHRQT